MTSKPTYSILGRLGVVLGELGRLSNEDIGRTVFVHHTGDKAFADKCLALGRITFEDGTFMAFEVETSYIPSPNTRCAERLWPLVLAAVEFGEGDCRVLRGMLMARNVLVFGSAHPELVSDVLASPAVRRRGVLDVRA